MLSIAIEFDAFSFHYIGLLAIGIYIAGVS